MLESTYQARLIKKIKRLLPGSFVLKNDTDYIQGIPDLTVLYGGKWAWLEVKVSADAPIQPNQEYYIDMAFEMAYGAFIYPENEERTLHELQQALEPATWESRFSEPK